jgi:hypothetical protein
MKSTEITHKSVLDVVLVNYENYEIYETNGCQMGPLNRTVILRTWLEGTDEISSDYSLVAPPSWKSLRCLSNISYK